MMDQVEGQPETPIERRTNPLGLAGFIISLVGLCTGGFLSPIGLIISLVALKDQPKGFAIAGIVLGALGSCGILIPFVVLIFVLPAVLIGALAAGGTALAFAGVLLSIVAIFGMNDLAAMIEMSIIADEAKQYEQQQGALPTDISQFSSGLTSERLEDPWGQQYRYELLPAGDSFRLWSIGEDGQDATNDDIEIIFRRNISGHWESEGRGGQGMQWNSSSSGSSAPSTPPDGATPDQPAPE